MACAANWPVRHDLRGCSTIRQAHMTESFQPARHSRLSSTAQPCQDSGFVYRWESCTTNARGGEDSRAGLLLIAPSDPSFRCLDCSGPSVTGGWCRGVQPLALLLSSHPLTDPPVHGVPKRSDCDGIRTGLCPSLVLLDVTSVASPRHWDSPPEASSSAHDPDGLPEITISRLGQHS